MLAKESAHEPDHKASDRNQELSKEVDCKTAALIGSRKPLVDTLKKQESQPLIDQCLD
jgi:hypothetical protein